MAQSEVLRPRILWAQRNDTLLLTVNLTDIKNEKFSLDEKKLIFEGMGGPDERQYACELEFMKEVVPQESKHKKTDRGLYFVIKKKTSGPYWSRLLSDSKKHPYIHTDFNRWKDEDESDSESENPYDDSSLNNLMQQMGGMGGGGQFNKPNLDDLDDSTDSDDEPLPDLES